MLTPRFVDLVNHHFDALKGAAAFFHVQPITVKRWLTDKVPVNPMAEKLMNIHARGYLPLDHRWDGFKINVAHHLYHTRATRVNSSVLGIGVMSTVRSLNVTVKSIHLNTKTASAAISWGSPHAAKPWGPSKFK